MKMTKEELLTRLNDIEWDDFEVKEASGGLPKSMWETVSAFSNTARGWIILGVKERKTENGSEFIVNGVANPEQMEQDIVTTLRSRTKFSAPLSCKALKYKIDDKDVLVFEIPLSPPSSCCHQEQRRDIRENRKRRYPRHGHGGRCDCEGRFFRREIRNGSPRLRVEGHQSRFHSVIPQLSAGLQPPVVVPDSE